VKLTRNGVAGRDYPIAPAEWEEFQKKPVFRWEVKEPNYTYKNTMARGENPFEGTESGKIEFYSQELAEGLGTVKPTGGKNSHCKRAVWGRKTTAMARDGNGW